MTVNFGTLESTVIQGPLLCQLTLKDAVRLAGVNQHLRVNIGLAFENIGKQMVMQCTDLVSKLRSDLDKEVVDHSELKSTIALLEKVRFVYQKYLVDPRGNILLCVAKIARIFPELCVRELEDIQRMSNLTKNLNELIQYLYPAIKSSQVFPLAFALKKEGEMPSVDKQFQHKKKVILYPKIANFSATAFGFNFLRRFSSLTQLHIHSPLIGMLPASIYSLPIRELNISSCCFTAFPPLPQSIEIIRFEKNPILNDSDRNHDLHTRIKAGIIKHYQFLTCVLSDSDKIDFAEYMFSQAILSGSLSKANKENDTSYEILGTPVYVAVNEVIFPYLTASKEVQEMVVRKTAS